MGNVLRQFDFRYFGIFFSGEGLAEWVPPNGGMFLWLKTKGVDDTFNMIMENGLRNKIMATPGREFMVDKSKPCPFVRLSFSVVPEDQIEQVCSILLFIPILLLL